MFCVSIIIPVYNAEKYLKNTIDSVINQSIGFENIELILVDDCSTDSSRDIISEHAKNYENVFSYFSNENHGRPGFGRNWGIKNASADYILFLDNDDLLDFKICEKLYSLALKEHADICGCNRIISDNVSEVKYSNLDGKNNLILNGEDILTFNNIVIHGKLYKRDFLLENNVLFPEDLSSEDFIFSTKCYTYAKKLIYVDNYHGYVWNIRGSSLSHSNKKYIFGTLEASYHILDFLKSENKYKYFPYVFRHTVRVLIRDCFRLDEDFIVLKRFLKDLYQFEKEINFNILHEQFWITLVNFFVIHKQFTISVLLIKFGGRLLNSNLVLNIFRKLKGSN